MILTDIAKIAYPKSRRSCPYVEICFTNTITTSSWMEQILNVLSVSVAR